MVINVSFAFCSSVSFRLYWNQLLTVYHFGKWMVIWLKLPHYYVIVSALLPYYYHLLPNCNRKYYRCISVIWYLLNHWLSQYIKLVEHKFWWSLIGTLLLQSGQERKHGEIKRAEDDQTSRKGEKKVNIQKTSRQFKRSLYGRIKAEGMRPGLVKFTHRTKYCQNTVSYMNTSYLYLFMNTTMNTSIFIFFLEVLSLLFK